MKALKKIFLINAIVELAGGAVVMINPQLLLLNEASDNADLNLSKVIGIAAFTLGVISYQMYRHDILTHHGAKMIALAILLYHMLIGFVFYSMYHIEVVSHMGAGILHLVLAGVFGLLYISGLEPKAKT